MTLPGAAPTGAAKQELGTGHRIPSGSRVGRPRQPDTIGNLALYYQKGRFQSRLAYRYQDYELDDIGDELLEDDSKGTRFQWDAQFSVRVTDRFSIYGNVQDITGELDDVVVVNKTRVGLREVYGFTARLGVRVNL